VKRGDANSGTKKKKKLNNIYKKKTSLPKNDKLFQFWPSQKIYAKKTSQKLTKNDSFVRIKILQTFTEYSLEILQVLLKVFKKPNKTTCCFKAKLSKWHLSAYILKKEYKGIDSLPKNSILLIPISLQPNVLILWYFKLSLFALTKFIIWNI